MSEQDSKKEILKSTGILGSAQLLIIGFGVIRVKVLAVLLGPVGVGMAGLYQQTIDFLKSLTGFGLSYSAVRDIATSAASGNDRQVAETILVLRRMVWATGILGMLLCIAFAKQLSQWTFGDDEHALEIGVLSVTLLLTAISSGQSALLQGLREIGNMAKANVVTALVGLVVAIVIYYFWGIRGIVPALLLTSLSTLGGTWYFTRKIKTVAMQLSPVTTFLKGKSMLQLGFFMSLSGIATAGSMYLVRSFVVQQDGLASVGYFVAAWSISTLYISAIFGAMSADYFPRLSAVQHDPVAVSRMVNEQSEIAILLAAPIIAGMISFLPWVVQIFYSKEFGPTATILSWQLFGDFFKVLAWPVGFIILAKGRSQLFLVTELTWHLMFFTLVFFGWKYFSIEITGIAFLVAYALYLGLIYILAVKSVQFKWTANVFNYIIFFLPLIVFSFLSTRYLQGISSYIAGTILTTAAIGFSFFHLKKLIDINGILVKLKLKSTL